MNIFNLISLLLVLQYQYRFDGIQGIFRSSSIYAHSPVAGDPSSRPITNHSSNAFSHRKVHWERLLDDVKECVDEDLEMLERASEEVIGMRILQQFVIDLLGRKSSMATIFRKKTEAE